MKTKRPNQGPSILYIGARSMLVNNDIFNKKNVKKIKSNVKIKNNPYMKRSH